ncbi:MAG TPA: DUF1848 domain-containing protein [Candidatus Sulfotelmatobacter sp.]|jgi:hypothetical protein|nr:DUF1848 domain-containing protein [Candidatus Sulfotelmatobacter sp.]
MIVSASFRTDIPAFYGDWFRNRFAAGYCLVANPYGGAPYRVSLRRGVDGYVFWTRNAEPFLPALGDVRSAGLPFVVQYTVTGYPRALERSVPDAVRSSETIRRLAGDYGPRSVVWRYDPILLSGLTLPEWHVRNFAALARRLEGSVDEVTVSFAQIYKKTERNLNLAARALGFSWRNPDAGEKNQALERLRDLAAERGMRLTLCAQPDLSGEAARCIDAQRLADVGGRPFSSKTKGNRPGCLCAESRDIGAYDSCPHGCLYCYAVSRRAVVREAFRRHDPLSESLIPFPGPKPCL